MNGPVPEATVPKNAGAPGQLVNEVSSVADVLVKTVSVAQLVTLVQKPATCTQYWPASDAEIFVIENELLVAPDNGEPALLH